MSLGDATKFVAEVWTLHYCLLSESFPYNVMSDRLPNSDILVQQIILVLVLVQFGQINFSFSLVLVQQINLILVQVQFGQINFSFSSSSK